ncbi:hypothetical protein EON81_08145, partial [bacterium]
MEALEAELSPSLNPGELSTRIAEAEAHLDDGISARIELGLTPADAEREAVEAFGKPRSVAQAIVRPVYVLTVRTRLRWLVAAYALVAGVYVRLDLLTEAVTFLAPALLSTLVLCAIGVATASFRSRRCAGLPILLMGLGAGVFFWAFFGVAWLKLWPYGG